jgi:Asp/Glu/hydantoin racemase
MRLWHQSFTVLEDLPDYTAALTRHLRSVSRPDTEVVLHGMRPGTYRSEYPGTDIRYGAIQHLHANQFMLGGLAAEKQGYDGYMITTIPDPALAETRSMLGRRFGILNFIEELGPQLEENVRRYGLGSRLAGVRHVGFGFNDVARGFAQPAEIVERFCAAAREMARLGADVIIPGEAVLCVLLASQRLARVDNVTVIDALAATVKMAELMVELRRVAGVEMSRANYFTDQPPAARVLELLRFYGLERQVPEGET